MFSTQRRRPGRGLLILKSFLSHVPERDARLLLAARARFEEEHHTFVSGAKRRDLQCCAGTRETTETSIHLARIASAYQCLAMALARGPDLLEQRPVVLTVGGHGCVHRIQGCLERVGFGGAEQRGESHVRLRYT